MSWNDLPPKVADAESVSAFKKELIDSLPRYLIHY